MEIIRARKSSLSLDLAPLIDVVFQLLVFFMLTASFTNPAINLRLPTAVTADEQQTQNIVINVERNGKIYINSNETKMDSLKGELTNLLKGNVKKSVHVKGDQQMPYKYFVEVMDVARQAGARQVNIVHTGKK